MPQATVTFDSVREIGRELPEVEESTMYGAPALKVRGDLLACVPRHKSAEPGSLAVRIDFEQRAGLLEEAPQTYYLTDHYTKYPIILLRMSRIRVDELRDLLKAAWRFVTSQKSKAPSRILTRSVRGPSLVPPRSEIAPPGRARSVSSAPRPAGEGSARKSRKPAASR